MKIVSDYLAASDPAQRESGELVGKTIRFQYRSSDGETKNNTRRMVVTAHWVARKDGEVCIAGETDIGFRCCKPGTSLWLSKVDGKPVFELVSD